MNKEQLESKWDQIKGSAKEKWGKLTDDDMMHISGKYDQFVGVLKEKYGFEKEKAEKEIAAWLEEAKYHKTSR